MKHGNQQARLKGLCRDTENGLVLGVCAGIADHFGWPCWMLRLCVLAIGWIFTVPVVAAYLLAAVLMPQRPLHYCGEGNERSFWQNHRHRS